MAQTNHLSEAPEPGHLDILLAAEPDDDRAAAADLLDGVGHRVHVVSSDAEALSAIRSRWFDVIIADTRSDAIDGFALLGRARAARPSVHIILAASEPSIDDAVAATRARADYLIKPLGSKNLLGPVSSVARRREAEAALASRSGRDCLVGRSPLLDALIREAGVVARADGAVLVSGETGTGKGLVARLIHDSGPRAGGPLVEIDCAVIEPGRAAADLFGDGGAFERARGGTVILDHIDSLTPLAQARLMHELDSERLGPGRVIDARVVAITSGDVAELVEAGALRRDLACVLEEFHLEVPSLRRRRDDLPLLVAHFCHKHARTGADVPRVAPAVWAVLAAERWSGNVRELEHTIKHALAFHDGGDLRVEHLPAELRARWPGVVSEPPPDRGEVPPLDAAIADFEHQYVRQALARTEGNRTRAASLLGISRKSLWAKLKRYEQRHPLLWVAWQR